MNAVPFKLPEHTYQALKEEAKLTGNTMASIVRGVLAEHFEKRGVSKHVGDSETEHRT